MKERPILFSGPMVKAILEGRKTQTRRVYGLIMDMELDGDESGAGWEPCPRSWPYGVPGDRLWVRESFQIGYPTGSVGDEWIGDELAEVDGPLPKEKPEDFGFWWNAYYKADDPEMCSWWRPSIHMPRWASRITLEIVRVHVEQLQEITPENAEAEGMRQFWVNLDGDETGCFEVGKFQDSSIVDAYMELWDSLNAKRGYPWVFNPWVWVIEFKRV